MKRIAVIGAGVSGLTTARILSEENRNRVVVYEKENTPGGLIRCMQVDGSLFHISTSRPSSSMLIVTPPYLCRMD